MTLRKPGRQDWNPRVDMDVEWIGFVLLVVLMGAILLGLFSLPRLLG